jgi:hypothetical protein
MAHRTKFLGVTSFSLVLCSLLAWCCSCTTESSLAGNYTLLVKLEHEAETLSLQEDRTYHKRKNRVFRNVGRWYMRRKSGYVYVVFENWRMRRADCLSKESKSEIASFEVDGDVLWLIKDLPECAYQKVD